MFAWTRAMMAMVVMGMALALPPPDSPSPWIVFGLANRKDCKDGFNYSPPFEARGNCITIRYGQQLVYSFRVDCTLEQIFSLFSGPNCDHAQLFKGRTPACLDNFFPNINVGVCCSAFPPGVNLALGRNASSSPLHQQQQRWLGQLGQQRRLLRAKQKTDSAFSNGFCLTEVCGPKPGTTKPMCDRKAKLCGMKWTSNKCTGKYAPKPTKGYPSLRNEGTRTVMF
ncbi:hypothetical protein BASA81_002341 [Batrachochytrium salamandrivorans]|nr:hypothetical protein BASA81_002341 [Batrachochytrium salamandrivorans]